MTSTQQTRSRKFSIVGVVFVLVGGLAIAMAWSPLRGDSTRLRQSSPATASLPPYQKLQDRLEAKIDLGERLCKSREHSAIYCNNLALSLLSHGRLTGRLSSFEKALETINAVFKNRPDNLGPFLVRATIMASLHRFREAKADAQQTLQAASLPTTQKAEAIALIADVDFQTGNYDAALHGYIEAAKLYPSVATLSRLARAHALLGDIPLADALYIQAQELLAKDELKQHAWLELQRGVLDLEAGKYRAAETHFLRGNHSFSGWWLIEEHMAEVAALLGQEQEAITLYEKIVNKSDNPEFMHALSGLLANSQPSSAEALSRRAQSAYDDLLSSLPEAAWGHLVHFKMDCGDSETALELAQKNFQLRPGAEARIALSQALFANGRWQEATAMIESALAMPLQVAELYATASQILGKVGRTEEAEQYQMQAQSMRLDAMDQFKIVTTDRI